MNAEVTLQRIPLDKLSLSPLNARKTTTGVVDDIAASIAAIGLMQNLLVVPGYDTEPEKADHYQVIAGGRRLAALKALEQRGELPAELGDGIPCRVIDVADGAAIEASAAENTLRERMHPADEFDAFKAMVDNGRTIPEVADHFGTTERHIRQRLKLANVKPELLDLYRQGKMSLEQLQALALTDNHEVQRQAWESARYDWERGARNLRDFITREEVQENSKLALFVGLEAYQAANGNVRSDLFSDSRWLTDRALLDSLAMDKLQAVADELVAQGWAWAEPHIELEYSQRSEYPELMAEHEAEERWASADDEKRAAEIRARVAEIENGPPSDEDEFDEEFQRLDDELNEICDRRIYVYPEEIKARSGVLLSIVSNGQIQAWYARLKPGQKVDRKTGAVTGQPKADEPAKPKPATIPAKVLFHLSAHRTEAVRHRVLRDPQVALALLVDCLIGEGKHETGHVLRIGAKHARKGADVGADIDKTLGKLDDIPEVCTRKLPRKDQRLAWLVQLPQGELLQLLALLVGSQIDGITEDPRGEASIDALHAILGVDMAQHWTVQCDDYLGRIPAALRLQAVTEARGKEAAATIAGMRKAEQVAEAAKLLAGTGWLPKPLRGPGYSLRAGGKSEKPKAKPADGKKAPAKKASGKSKGAAAAKKAAAKKVTASKQASKGKARTSGAKR